MGRLLRAQSFFGLGVGGWGWTRSLLKTDRSQARCSVYLLLTTGHKGMKQQPFYYACNFLVQEIKQGMVEMVYLFSTMFGAYKVVLIVRDSWARCPRAVCLGFSFACS